MEALKLAAIAIDREDMQLFHRTDSIDEAFEIVTRHLIEHAMAERGAIL